MNLIEERRRKEILLQFGFYESFLDVVDDVESIDYKLSYVMNYPEGAYYYLPTIENYSIYKGYNVVPICDSGQGDSFYTLLFNDSYRKIIYNEIEQDEIYADFGLNIDALIAKVLIGYYELMDEDEVLDREMTLRKIKELGEKLGIEEEAISNVIKRVFISEDDNEDRFFNSRNWFDKNIKPLLKKH